MSETTTVFRGDRMREARKNLMLTQDELAERTGLTRPQVTNLELGNSEPSIRALALVAHELQVSADWLLDLSEASKSEAHNDSPIPLMELYP